MTAFSKTYTSEVWDLATVAALLLALLTHYPTDTVPGLVILAGFVAVCWRVGMTLGRWTADRDIIRRVRQEAAYLSQEADR